MTPLQHYDLLRRNERALSLRSSILEACRPGGSVLDAGCGSGLLSFWAVGAGAAEAVAVDVCGLDLARELAIENGVSDSIRFIEADLWELDLPSYRKGFDLVLAMVYLNDPRRDERQSALAYSLRERFLSPNGVMIPNKVRYAVHACDWPSQDYYDRSHRIRAGVRELEAKYGLKLTALSNAIEAECWKTHFPVRRSDGRLDVGGARALSDPSMYVLVDYTAEPVQYPEDITITTGNAGVFNSLIWTQELIFEDRLLFMNESISWVENPRIVQAGECLSVKLGPKWRTSNLVSVDQQETRPE